MWLWLGDFVAGFASPTTKLLLLLAAAAAWYGLRRTHRDAPDNLGLPRPTAQQAMLDFSAYRAELSQSAGLANGTVLWPPTGRPGGEEAALDKAS
jgi:hypothetical protein